MVDRFEDLAPLIAPARLPDAPAVGFRQGVVESWDQLTAANTVRIGGTLFTNVPILNTTEANLLVPGDVVAILVTGSGGASTYAILGRCVIPGTPAAATALTAIRASTAEVATRQSTTSTPYVDLATVGPTISNFVVGSSGRVKVTLSAYMESIVPTGFSLNTAACFMSVDLTGPTNSLPADSRSAALLFIYDAGVGQSPLGFELHGSISRELLYTGLTPGSYTFTAKYSARASNAAWFSNRTLIVEHY